MRKIIVSIIAVSLLIIGCQKSNNYNYVFATGGTSGTYYSFGGSIASIWNANIEGMNVTAQSTGASAENLRLLNRHEADLAFVQNDVMDYAYNGTDIFAGEVLTNFSAMLTLYPEIVQIAASKSSGIKTIADMKGKRVSVGDAGSGVEFNAKQILVSELVLAEHASQEEVEKLVDNKINISFDEYKLPQENIDINQNIVSKFIPFDGTGTSENL